MGLVAAAIAIVGVNALVWHLFLALAFSHPRVRAAYARRRRALNRFSSVAIGVLGLRLVATALTDLKAKLAGGAT